MKIENILVNWSLDDEEVLEPYEWEEDDDLEVLACATLLHVSDEALFDLYYGVLKVLNLNPGDYLCSNGKSILALRIIQEDGRLGYRSVLPFKYRQALCEMAKCLPLTSVEYDLYARAETKEYGLSREEREKKQWLFEHLELLDQNELNGIYRIALPLDKTISKKQLLSRLEYGYDYLHEYLYQRFVTPKRLS